MTLVGCRQVCGCTAADIPTSGLRMTHALLQVSGCIRQSYARGVVMLCDVQAGVLLHRRRAAAVSDGSGLRPVPQGVAVQVLRVCVSVCLSIRRFWNLSFTNALPKELDIQKERSLSLIRNLELACVSDTHTQL